VKRIVMVVAALACVGHADEGAVELIGELQSPDPVARFRGAQALRELGPAAKPALPHLVEALKDEHPYVRVEAARALVALGITKAEVAPLVERLGPADPEVGLLVAEALAGLGEPAVPALLKVLGGKDERARRGALVAVGLLGRHAAAAVPDLLDLLATDDPAARKLAGEALRRSAPWARDYVPEILDRLRFGKPEVRWAAASVLARIGPAAKGAVEALKEMRAEGDEQLASAAAEALARIDVGGVRGPGHPALRTRSSRPRRRRSASARGSRPRAARSSSRSSGRGRRTAPTASTTSSPAGSSTARRSSG
jgi:HEAT repeat protein